MCSRSQSKVFTIHGKTREYLSGRCLAKEVGIVGYKHVCSWSQSEIFTIHGKTHEYLSARGLAKEVLYSTYTVSTVDIVRRSAKKYVRVTNCI